jgi:hypothetical protein
MEINYWSEAHLWKWAPGEVRVACRFVPHAMSFDAEQRVLSVD